MMLDKKKIAVILVAAIALLGIVIVIWNLDTWFSDPWEGDSGDGASTVFIDGVAYQPKRMTNYLIIGVDEFGVATDGDSYNNTKQADFLMLLSFDHTKDTYSILHLNRDTMTMVDQLGVTGEKSGEKQEQLALAHTYGNGSHISCRNTVRAVSELLYGLPIDYYISMTMDAVAVLNDYVGGVPVTVTEDLTEIDASLVAGAEVTLSGELALKYVRARSGLSDSTNLARMERQKQYMDSFIRCLAQKEITEDFIGGMYEESLPYLVTNAGVQTLNGVFTCLADYTYDAIYTIAGEAKEGEEFIEFYIDEESLKAISKALYYEPVHSD